MPSPRWLLLLALPFLMAGCNDRSLQQRADEIRRLSDKEDRVYAAEALEHIRRDYWTPRDRSWLGKLPDGTIIRLDSPHASAAPLPTSNRGWHLQLTISSDDYRTYPASTGTESFQAVYAITRYSATNWNIQVSEGPTTSPLRRDDLAQLQNEN